MTMKFFLVPCAAILAVIFGTHRSAAQSLALGEAQNFNAVIFGNHTATSADTEGRLAVGGNAQYPSSYSVGQSVVGPQNPQSNGKRNDLVVGGNVNLPGGVVTVNFGDVKIGGSQTGNGSFSQSRGNKTDTGVQNFAADVFDFATVNSTVSSYSMYWSGLTANGTTNDQGFELGLIGSNTLLNVFDVTAAQWDLFGARVIDIPVGSTAIINISGLNVSNSGGDIRFGSSASDNLNPALFRENVIYNLTDATTIQSEFLLWEGSVFAPNATLSANGGAINGQAFLGGATQTGGFEFHNFMLNAQNAPIPEPSTALLSICAVFASCLRRKR